MFVPCDRCLQREGSYFWIVRKHGAPRRLRLCDLCYLHVRWEAAPPEGEGESLDTELAMARTQEADRRFRRIPPLPGYDVSVFHRPSFGARHDFYDVIEIDADHVGLVVAATSAAGLPAAVAMTEASALFRHEAPRARSPAETLHRMNRVLHNDLQRGTFVTALYAVLSPRANSLSLASAGHNPMVLWRRESRRCELVNPHGIGLGIDQGPLFEKILKQQEIGLAPGDRFVLCADGLLETADRAGRSYGQDRFNGRVRELADLPSAEFLDLLVRDVDRHRGDAPQLDDFLLLTGRRIPGRP